MKLVTLVVAACLLLTPRVASGPVEVQVEEDTGLNQESLEPLETRGSSGHARQKRSFFELHEMVTCATNCDPFLFIDYGCFCGPSNFSSSPVDGIDRCCQIHDACYERARCPADSLYFVPFLWSCDGGAPRCETRRRTSCNSDLCQCDREFAVCLQQFPCPSTRAPCTAPVSATATHVTTAATTTGAV